ncbi:Helix-turn-helix domain-containing protein [Thermomonospora echinospora]|uniref:Helix-turn-helix domain-containing protein n=1 Tax=Thermomonospora echinospora TaxID=1992 RepID=A0A1H5Z5I4_9ACTN|nr:helix-turn-helix transcriptional regulator [Thermomonospora echinospora]SEG31270.1 Helix-turn-helix domain-containing protein [Thermomonospora echinospora]
MGDQMTMGKRVARARKRKGWDQATLAQAMDRSVSWVTKIENGRLPLDRASVVAKLAQVLEVEVAELTGQPYRHETAELDSGHATIPELRLALQQATMPGGAAMIGERDPAPLAELAGQVTVAEKLRQDARFSALGDILPKIINDLTLHTAGLTGADRDRAEALMLRACHMARVTSNLLGHHDLGWTAVQRELVAAERVGSPELVAASAWDLCGVWLHETALDGAKSAALAALDDIDEHMGAGDPNLRALWGALHLRAAVAYSRLLDRQEAESHLSEAQRVAEELPADGNVFQTQFNRVNTRIHAVEISLELGRPREVTSRAEQVEVSEIASGERQAHYWTCRAAGMAMNRKEDKAVEALLTADRIAPQHVRNRPLVRNLVRDLRSSGRHSKGPQIRALAARMRLD